jgi:hypothetical protein
LEPLLMTSPQIEVEHWSLDRKIPAALVVAMLAQLMGFGWYASKVDSRVEDLEKRTIRTETQVTTMDRDVRNFDTRMVRVEEKIGAVLDIVRRLERIVDRRNGDAPERP